MMTTAPIPIALAVSHPIQYFAHRYRWLAGQPGVKVKVFFGSRMGLDPYFDKEFGKTFAWKMPILEGYDHAFPEPGGWGRELAAFKPARVWIHGYSDPCTRSAWRHAVARGVPVYVSGDSNLRKEFKKPRLLRLVKQAVLRPFFATLGGFLSVGESNEAWYRYYGVPARRMIRAPFTVDPSIFGPVQREAGRRRAELRERLSIPADAVTALWCGKITDLKRPRDFTAALAELRRKGGPPVHALFAGDGALRDAVERETREAGVSAAFAGFMNVDEVPAAYAAADFLVHTCLQESYGLVATEAAAMGLPMILPASMGAIGPTDAARPGVNALVYPDGDVARLAEQVGRLAADRAERERMGAESKRVYESLEETFRQGMARMIAADSRS